VTPTWGPRYWAVYLIVGLVLLVGPETLALITNWHNTLSSWVWTALKVQRDASPLDWSATQFLIFGLWIVLVSWLTFHFFFHRFT
jgi:hypothetical protein